MAVLKTPKLEKVAAQWVAQWPGRLRPGDATYLDGEGKPLIQLHLHQGDTLMISPIELYGQTVWHDPRQQLPSRWIGVGHAYEQPEHAELPEEELAAMGYEYQAGSANWEPVESSPSSPSTSASPEDSGDDDGSAGSSGRGRGERGKK